MYTIELSHYKDFEGFTHTEIFDVIEEITTAERWYNDFVNNGNTLDGFNGEDVGKNFHIPQKKVKRGKCFG